MKKYQKMSTCNLLDLEILGSCLVMLKILSEHWPGLKKLHLRLPMETGLMRWVKATQDW